jgi:hypothetical protein
MPLVEISLDVKTQRDVEVLRSLPNLKLINDRQASGILNKQ